MEQGRTEKHINPGEFLEDISEELADLANQANASIFNPVVVVVDKNSPWVTRNNVLLSAISLHYESDYKDGFLKGCGDWNICQIAAKSSEEVAEYVLEIPADPAKVKVVMFYEAPTGLRVACAYITLTKHLLH